jgi:hypothetical protein
MSTFYAQSLLEHPGHPDQRVHGGKSRVTGVEYSKTTAPVSGAEYSKMTAPVSGATDSVGLTFKRKDKSGLTWSKTYKGKSAERGYERVNALARSSNPKALLKRTPPTSWGSVQTGRSYSYGFTRRAGK